MTTINSEYQPSYCARCGNPLQPVAKEVFSRMTGKQLITLICPERADEKRNDFKEQREHDVAEQQQDGSWTISNE